MCRPVIGCVFVCVCSLRDVSLDVASPLVMTNRTLPSVEQCQCPEGYAGLSCEVSTEPRVSSCGWLVAAVAALQPQDISSV